MLQTVLQQNYTGSLAVDTSGFSNHGLPIHVTPSLPGFSFSNPGGRINVKPSPSLSSLGVINLEVKFAVSPGGPSLRYNLAEGFESFALIVNTDLSLAGTILDASGNWTGATSAAGIVTPGVTHVATLQCDGINMVRLLLDGVVVASNFAVNGQVRGVGALGLAIGHWPNPPNQYTFHGTIYSVALQRYLPQSDLSYINPCCFDRVALADWFRVMQKKGVTQQKLLAASRELQAVTLQATRLLRGDDATRTAKHQSLTQGLRSALKRQDCDALEAAVKALADFADAELDAATRLALAKEIQLALERFGLSFAEWNKLMNLFCLSPCGCS